jgi:Domain of unknown function (DUF6484)
MILKSERMQEAVVSEREQFDATNRKERAPLEFGGALIGTLAGFARDGEALIDLPDNESFRRTPARSCIRLASSDVGKEAVLLFEGGDCGLPIIVGLLQPRASEAGATTRVGIASAARSREVELDGKNIELTAQETITLRCGDASITLNRDGKIVIRGMHVVSHAAGVNRIRGGSVQLN